MFCCTRFFQLKLLRDSYFSSLEKRFNQQIMKIYEKRSIHQSARYQFLSVLADARQKTHIQPLMRQDFFEKVGNNNQLKMEGAMAPRYRVYLVIRRSGVQPLRSAHLGLCLKTCFSGPPKLVIEYGQMTRSSKSA